jgi:hypothetical protein
MRSHPCTCNVFTYREGAVLLTSSALLGAFFLPSPILLDFVALYTLWRLIMNEDVVDGYACPVDPMEALMCESCQ